MVTFYRFNVFILLCSAVSPLPTTQSADSVGYVSVPFTKARRARSHSLDSRQDKTTAASVHNDIFSYHVEINVGSPPQPLELLLDTGSSDIFVFSTSCSGCSSEYYDTSKSSTFKQLPNLGAFGIAYGDGSSISGYYASDQIGLADAVVPQTIAVATKAKGSGFDDGIFGIGLDQAETIVDNTHSAYPGYISTLKDQGRINRRAYSIYLNSKTPGDSATGLIILGGYDSTKWSGDLVAFPMVEKAPDGQYRLDVLEPTFDFDAGAGSVSVGGVSSTYTVLMDTGTALCYIPTAQFNVISKAVGAQIVGSGPVYSVDCALAQKPNGIGFKFEGPNGGVTVNVPWTELAVPDSTIPNGRCAFGLAPASNSETSGVYTLGDTFIRSAYLLFDYDNLTISIAQVKYDDQKRSKIKAF